MNSYAEIGQEIIDGEWGEGPDGIKIEEAVKNADKDRLIVCLLAFIAKKLDKLNNYRQMIMNERFIERESDKFYEESDRRAKLFRAASDRLLEKIPNNAGTMDLRKFVSFKYPRLLDLGMDREPCHEEIFPPYISREFDPDSMVLDRISRLRQNAKARKQAVALGII